MAELEQAASPEAPPIIDAAPDPALPNAAPEGDSAAANSAGETRPPASAPAEGAALGEAAAPVELSAEELERIEQERIRKEEEENKLEEERIRKEEEENKLEEERIGKGEEEKKLEEERIQKEEEEKKLEEERIRLEEEQRKLEEEERKRLEGARLRMLVESIQEELSGLKQENAEFQRRVCILQKKRRSVNAEQFILEGQENHYQTCLNIWSETKVEFNRLKDEYDKKIDSMRDKLQEKQSESDARHEGMVQYFWKIARDSADIVSGQRIPRRTLQALEQEERDTIIELQAVRIRGRQLKSQLAKLERKLELKDQLPGPLHLVDYEELKMENESLNEKIHMKNEALTTLRKKTVFLVHLLTHVREKMQFIAVECKEKGEELANDDKTLHGGRIKLSWLKSSIMSIIRKRQALQKNVVTVSAPVVVDDIDYQREDIEVGEKALQDLKKRYHDLIVNIEETKKNFSPWEPYQCPVGKAS